MNLNILIRNSQQALINASEPILYSLLQINPQEFYVINADLDAFFASNNNTETKGNVIQLACLNIPCSCPKCGSNVLLNHGIRKLKLKTIDLYGKPTCFEVLFRRYKCSDCHSNVQPEISIQHKGSHITTSLHSAICSYISSEKFVTYKKVASTFGLSEYYVKKFYNEQCDQLFRSGNSTQANNVDEAPKCLFDPPKEQVKSIMVDEVSLRGRNYITCFYNAANGDLIYWGLKNTKETIRGFFEWSKNCLSDNISICCDMNAPFYSAFKELLPNCTITFDRFHLMKHFKEDLTYAVKRIARKMPEISKVKDLFFDKESTAYRLLFTRCTEISKKEKRTLNKIFKESYVLKQIYDVYQDFIVYYDKANDRKEFKEKVLSLCTRILNIEVFAPEFVCFKKDPKLFHRCCCDFLLGCVDRSLMLSNLDKPKDDSDNIEDCSKTSSKKTSIESPLTRLVRRFVKHLDGITMFAFSHMTTGPIEGYNNAFKVLKRMKFGIKNLSRFMDVLRLGRQIKYSKNLKTIKLKSS